jgi:hypothetical protein
LSDSIDRNQIGNRGGTKKDRQPKYADWVFWLSGNSAGFTSDMAHGIRGVAFDEAFAREGAQDFVFIGG